ncbi:uncharacterized protein LOC121733390 [Aricia agestis]|uniref:uncharacterized protein LOC121733390 n=1 Tax=Aricia agestis TaxID=91739 RepID=UPI001C208786|nr:uncharacterized protein LOC121733390 [Aricia agestis]
MPPDVSDVSDLRDVVDAINKLCETMKTSYDYDDQTEEVETKGPSEPEACQTVTDAEETSSEPSLAAEIAAEMYYSAIAEASLDVWNDSIGEVTRAEPAPAYDTFYNALSDGDRNTGSSEEHAPVKSAQSPVEFATCRAAFKSSPVEAVEFATCRVEIKTGPPEVAPGETEPSKDFAEIETAHSMDPVATESDHRRGQSSELAETQSITSEERKTEGVAYETASEMYYTASSEVSLLSDADMMEKMTDESDKEKSDRNIMAGHVAAMRERFESMTRANTPCPDLVRSLSPSLDMFRNITPSPDFLDKS